MAIDRKVLAGLAIGLIALNGCAARHGEVASVPAPVQAPLAPMPQPPAGAYAGMTVPARLADGSYATPNNGLDAGSTVWHVRVALNVAALGCRGAEGQAITAGYNAMLSRDKAELARANAATIKAKGGQARYDAAMTRLYNYFAQPGAQQAFCAAAARVTSELAGFGALGSAAPAALAELDRPFTDFYRAYDAYRVELAQWQADRLQRATRPLDETPRIAFAAAAPVGAGNVPHLKVDPAIFRMP
ncbi:hypothetical protein [Hephaestia mangrovi]|uniref:hypothetical protein n=1 Tax=Hephaestia mangrovi TaxID=2873268 RepID=UPI002102B86C|nr:hypothetical protein [Hephaestia mangrovi]